MQQFLTDDELLNVPLGNLTPGELARSFTVHAAKEQKVEEIDALHETQRFEQHTREEKQQEEQEALHQREEILLMHLAEQAEAIRVTEQQLDDRAIKLHDGRRAYLDGNGYRDAEGHQLNGADRAQAEVLHLEHPDAATWQEKQSLDERFSVITKQRHDIENLQAGKSGSNEEAVLSNIEKQLKQQTTDASSIVPDYSDTDYMAALGGLTARPQAKTAPTL